ncbi:hypothetical protein [Paenibacillus sp. FSL H7-0331]|nr:hypothetical protein [Paenibacillus sp. FSL H7-0331]
MQARMKNPAKSISDAMKAIQSLNAAVHKGAIWTNWCGKLEKVLEQ